MIKDSFIILKKELLRFFTDKRLVVLLIVVPMLLLPAIYFFVAKFGETRLKDISEYQGDIYVTVEDSEPSASYEVFYQVLDELNARIIKCPNEQAGIIKEFIAEKQAEILIVFPDNLEEKFANMQTADIQIFYNSSSDYSSYFYQKVKEGFNKVKEKLLRERLAELSLTEEVITPFTVNQLISEDEADLAKKGSTVGKGLGMMIPFFILISLFSNAQSVGLDSVTGEKERGSLALLLVNQVDRLSIILGKLFSVICVAFAGALSTMFGLFLAFRYIISMAGEFPIEIDVYIFQPMDFLQFAIVLLPAALIIVALVMIVATYARNIKEAQSMVMPVYIFVLFIGLFAMVSGDTPSGWMQYIPILNSLLGMKAIFMHEAVWSSLIISAISCLAVAVILVFYMLRMFEDEKILFRI
jgi:sodium transport system permease protein